MCFFSPLNFQDATILLGQSIVLMQSPTQFEATLGYIAQPIRMAATAAIWLAIELSKERNLEGEERKKEGMKATSCVQPFRGHSKISDAKLIIRSSYSFVRTARLEDNAAYARLARVKQAEAVAGMMVSKVIAVLDKRENLHGEASVLSMAQGCHVHLPFAVLMAVAEQASASGMSLLDFRRCHRLA